MLRPHLTRTFPNPGQFVIESLTACKNESKAFGGDRTGHRRPPGPFQELMRSPGSNTLTVSTVSGCRNALHNTSYDRKPDGVKISPEVSPRKSPAIWPDTSNKLKGTRLFYLGFFEELGFEFHGHPVWYKNKVSCIFLVIYINFFNSQHPET
ncbi:hypothetical protein GWI33_013897 [Rhynchophorus ferrugineus]|uniref:Uncharacterized protein n=1 Tax=Rhynchophorus ferrugineus TaxID=354439 RepID=A0A834I786_RHYFE|nr:hypothetical protein GWI33_013897 [Rhynchophorus ferrugineus]